MNTTITLKQYLDKGKRFRVPFYQRGYVWGKKRKGDDPDSVTYILDDIIQKYNSGNEIFLQGFTVTESEEEIVLIDGQQRTTFLYLLLKTLGYEGKIAIKYDVREKSGDFLSNINYEKIELTEDEEFQDVYFFKKTICIIKEKIADICHENLLSYLLEKVRFLYINIPEEQAISVFTMMNGARAEMKAEEIIKAEILRLASSSKTDVSSELFYSFEWDNNVLRSRYAREWDRWLHWWKQKKVIQLYRCGNNPLELLLDTFLHIKKGDELTFESFRRHCLKNGTPQESKLVFDQLRRLQKRFEDVYNDHEHGICNMVGAILAVSDEDGRRRFIQKYFVENCVRDKLHDYYLCIFMGLTHLQTMQLLDIDSEANKNKDFDFSKKYDEYIAALNDDFLYFNNKEIAFRTLLRLNVDEDIKQKRIFNFNVWFDSNRSLEHIWAKSKVWHWDELHKTILEGGKNEPILNDLNEKITEQEICSKKDEYLFRGDIKKGDKESTEHSIGNLVLLYKDENTKFNNSNFERKKQLFFSPQEKDLFKSRHLLHTICVFAEKKEWNGPAIVENKDAVLSTIENDYNNLKNKYYEADKQI